jgi:hypothetical protein
MTDYRLRNPQKLADFLEMANRNEQQVITQHPEVYALMERLQQSFQKMLSGTYEGPQIPAFLALAGHNYFLAGVRIALAGQMPPAFPVLRAGIESVLFGLLMAVDPSKEKIWTNRAKSKTAAAKCRDVFTGANGLRELKKLDADLYNGVDHNYSVAIGLGAHPNVGAVLPHTSIDDGGTHWLAQLRCIHPCDSFAVFDTTRYAVAAGACMLAMMFYALKGHAPAKVAYDEASEIMKELNQIPVPDEQA